MSIQNIPNIDTNFTRKPQEKPGTKKNDITNKDTRSDIATIPPSAGRIQLMNRLNKLKNQYATSSVGTQSVSAWENWKNWENWINWENVSLTTSLDSKNSPLPTPKKEV